MKCWYKEMQGVKPWIEGDILQGTHHINDTIELWNKITGIRTAVLNSRIDFSDNVLMVYGMSPMPEKDRAFESVSYVVRFNKPRELYKKKKS